MKKFFCLGKNGFCEADGSNKRMGCWGCKFLNGEGGEYREVQEPCSDEKDSSVRDEKPQNFRPGDEVWITGYDEDGDFFLESYMFMATVMDAAILCSHMENINGGEKSIEEVVQEHINETDVMGETSLLVVPLDRCFSSREDALEKKGE